MPKLAFLTMWLWPMFSLANSLDLPDFLSGEGRVVIAEDYVAFLVQTGPDSYAVGAPAIPLRDDNGDALVGTYSGVLTLETIADEEGRETLCIVVTDEEDAVYEMHWSLIPLPTESAATADPADAGDKSDCPRGKKCCSCEKGGYGDPCTASAVCGSDEIPVCDCEACTATCTPKKPVLMIEWSFPFSAIQVDSE